MTLEKDILERLKHYCCFRERSLNEVRKKLFVLGVREEKIQDNWLNHLKNEDFLNEDRYVSSFVRSKFIYQKWGKNKIKLALQEQRICATQIQRGLASIDDEAYREMVEKLVTNKQKTLFKLPSNLQRARLIQYLYQKGYEMEIIEAVLDA